MMYNNHNLNGQNNKYGTEAGRRRISKAVIETLETRQLMSSAALLDGTLALTGNQDSSNNMSVRVMADGKTLEVKTNSKTRTFDLADVDSIKITGSDRNDIVDVDRKLALPLDVTTFGGKDVVRTNDGSDPHDGDVKWDATAKKNLVVNTTPGPRIASFSLINADTDEVIAEFENLGDGMTLNLATLPTKNLNIRANVVDGQGGSVMFDFDGKTSIENVAHYTLAGNDKNDYHAWTPATGEFKLSATPYTLDKAKGVEGATKTITLNFTDGEKPVPDYNEPTPQPQPKPQPEPAPKPQPTPEPTPEPEPTPQPQPKPQPTPNPGPDDTGEVGAPVPVITAISKTVQAGHSIHVNALATNFKSGDAIAAKYEWNFGDADGRWNTLAGWNAAHVYNNAGTYTITLRVTNGAGKVATTTTKVTIAASTRRVIYVSNDGSDSNSGTSPDKAVKSFAKGMSFATNDTEVLFKRGDNWSLEAGAKLSGKNVVIGAYGTGSRPVLKYTGEAGYKKIISLSSTSQDVTIRGLAFDMHFSDLNKFDRPDGIGAAGVNVTIRDNEFINIGYGVTAASNPRGMYMLDNVAPRAEAIRSYFAWCEGSDISIVGNKVANSTREHNIRVVGVDRILIAHNDLTNTNGKVEGDKTPKGTLTIHRGSYIYISRNKLNNGPTAIGPLGDGDGLKSPGDRFNFAVVEENEFNTRLQIDHGAAHVMIRGNVFTDTSKSPVEIEGWNAEYKRGVSDVRIEDNLAVNSGKGFVKLMGGAVEGLKQSSNDFVSSVSGQTPWGEDGVSTPTQWQAVSTIFSKAA